MKAISLLRQSVVEREIRGSVESRDVAIEKFIGELRNLFTDRLIDSLSKEVIGGMFEDWLASVGKLSFEERMNALILDVRLCQIPFTMYRKGYVDKSSVESQTPPGNVVSLHAR